MDREGRSRTKKEAMEIDERTSQELAIMEYYMNMKPQKPFNAMVVGQRASLQQIVLSPDRSRSRSKSPKRSSMTKKETGYDEHDKDTLYQLEE
jgi:predicted aminopeptidase